MVHFVDLFCELQSHAILWLKKELTSSPLCAILPKVNATGLVSTNHRGRGGLVAEEKKKADTNVNVILFYWL